MEASLDLSAEPDDRPSPVVCVDETLEHLVSEVRQALPLGPGQPLRYDDD
jgi:DDE superfamily endonuclease